MLSRINFIFIFLFSFSLGAQVVLYDDPAGESYTNIDGDVTDVTTTVDITNCSSVEFSISYEFPAGWEGSGNMESADECCIDCDGDPANPQQLACLQNFTCTGNVGCWDFMWIQFMVDGDPVTEELIGEEGTTNIDNSGSFAYIFCRTDEEEAHIEITNQNWAASETNIYTNVSIICWEAVPLIEELEPGCGAGPVDLIGSVSDDSGAIQGWEWTTDGDGVIADPLFQETTITDIEDGDEITLTTVDQNNCFSSTSVEVMLDAIEASIDGGGTICISSCSDSDSDLQIEIEGGTGPYTADIVINGFNVPDFPAVNIEETFTICNDPDIFLPEFDENESPPQIIIPSEFFPITIELLDITDADGCQAEILNSTVSFDLAEEPEVNEPESPDYCVESSAVIDLTLMDSEISPDGFDILWFEDMDLDDQINDPAGYPASGSTTVYAAVDNGDCLSLAIIIELNINILPVISVFIDPITDCSLTDYILPDISEVADIDNAVNPGWYLDPNGESGPVTSIDPDQIDEIYIFDSSAEGCFDQALVQLDISSEPDIESPMNLLTGCDQLQLPEPEGSGFDDHSYNTESDGTGNSYQAGDNIFPGDGITTLYLTVTAEGGCSAITELDIEFESNLDFIVQLDTLICADSLVLPAIIPFTSSVSYFTEAGGNGIALSPGEVLLAPYKDTLYIFDPALDPSCSDEDTLSIHLTTGPEPVFPSDTAACEFIVLPEFGGITGPNILYARFPVTNPNSSLYPGDTLRFGQRLYVLDTIASCVFFDSLDVSIATEPFAGRDTSLIVCEGFDSGSFNFMELISNPDDDGQWTYPNVADFEPGDSSRIMLDVLIPGIYNFQYVIEDSLCGTYLSTIQIEIVSIPYGGENNNLDICSGGQAVDFMELVSFPDTGGEWSQISGPQSLFFNDSTSVDLTGLENGNYVFLYVIEGEAQTEYCEPESASLFVNIGSGVTAGVDNSLTACAGEVIDLIDYLSPDSNTGGTFEADDIIFNGTSWNTGAATAGEDYIINYIVTSNDPGCLPDTAIITVSLVDQLTAGIAISDNKVCEGEFINLSDYIEEESQGGIFVYMDQPTEEITDGFWTAIQDTSFLYIVGTDSNCPADTTGFDIEVIEEGIYDLELSSLRLCQSNPEEALSFVLYNLSNTEIEYEFSFFDENSNLLFQIDTVSFEDIEFYVGISPGINSISNDTIYLEFMQGVNIYNFRIEAFTANRQCKSSLVSTTSITMAESYSETIEATLCEGQSIDFRGAQYQNSTTITIPGNNFTECDSVFIIDITNIPQIPGSFSGVFCEGDTLTLLGEAYTQDFQGLERFIRQGAFGCDSLIEIDIEFESSIMESINENLCEDESLIINNTVYDINNISGTEVLQSSSGCDSIINIELQFSQFGESFLEEELCPGESFMVGPDSYDENNNFGTTILSNASSNGCDSIVNVSLSYLSNQESIIQNEICPNDIIMVGNDSYSAQVLSGTTILESAATNGCDSIIRVDLTLVENSVFELVDNICPGQTILVGSDSYGENNLSGTSLLENASVNGCDSIVNVNLQLSLPMAEISTSILCPDINETTAQISELTGIDFPAEVIINDNSQGSFNSLPIQFSLAAGVSDVLIQGLNGCQYEESILIEEFQPGDLNISSSELNTNTYQLGIQSNFTYDIINWSSTSGTLSCLNCENNSIIITEDTEVILSIITPEACEIIRSISLTFEEIIQTEAYYIPNIIDLNDPENRSFTLYTDGSVNVTGMRIFDRWGKLIFEEESSSLSNLTWDGRYNDRLVEQGVYVYNITILNQRGEQEILVGNLTLIR